MHAPNGFVIAVSCFVESFVLKRSVGFCEPMGASIPSPAVKRFPRFCGAEENTQILKASVCEGMVVQVQVVGAENVNSDGTKGEVILHTRSPDGRFWNVRVPVSQVSFVAVTQ